ncbi:MAG: hypothetical protein KAQ64_03865 [Candidatus Pacebacteria bacterium]|nr:hypothetical protein [Candidatus Paceibacterota bacterium]
MEHYDPLLNQSNSDDNFFQEKEDLFEVQECIEKLKLDFESEFGENIENCFSDGIEKSCKVHKFIFDEATKESDPEKRKVINLAHLKLESENHLNTKTTSPYGDKIGNSGKPLSETIITDFSYNQMLASGQEILKGSGNEKLRIDNNEIVDVFQNFSEDFLEITKILNDNHPDVDSKAKERTAIMAAVQNQLDEYFGNTNRDAGKNNKKMYKKTKTRNLHDFKGQSSATCTELSMLAQQLVSFAGVKSKFISGGPLEINNGENDNSASSDDTHVFNILYFQKEDGESAYLYDPANPMFIKNESDQSGITRCKYIAPLTKEQLERMKSQRNINIIHEGTNRVYHMSRI